MPQFIFVRCQLNILSKMNHCHQSLKLEPLNAKLCADPEGKGDRGSGPPEKITKII